MLIEISAAFYDLQKGLLAFESNFGILLIQYLRYRGQTIADNRSRLADSIPFVLCALIKLISFRCQAAMCFRIDHPCIALGLEGRGRDEKRKGKEGKGPFQQEKQRGTSVWSMILPFLHPVMSIL